MNKLTSLLNNDTDLELILGIFLLTLAVSGNFISETLNCKIRSLLSKNMYAKNIFILIIINFSLNLVGDKDTIPTEHLKNTFIIFITKDFNNRQIIYRSFFGEIVKIFI